MGKDLGINIDQAFAEWSDGAQDIRPLDAYCAGFNLAIRAVNGDLARQNNPGLKACQAVLDSLPRLTS